MHRLPLALVLLGAFMTHARAAEPQVKLADLVPDLTVEKLASGMQFTEGPIWFPENGGYLVFSDIPASKLMKWDGKSLSVFRDKSNQTNGNTRDNEGRLLSCEHESRRVTRTNSDGSVEVLIEQVSGKRFNSPNDIIVHSDNSIWFTDPTYGLGKTKPDLPGRWVFRVDPTSNLAAPVVQDFDQPNGLCFSPDQKKLYIADSGALHHIRVFDVTAAPPDPPGHKLANGKIFAVIDNGVPDGIRADANGNIWSSAGDGVQIFSPDGALVGKIPVPESPANLAFGGPDGKTLYITARTSLYSVRTNITGATHAAPAR